MTSQSDQDLERLLAEEPYVRALARQLALGDADDVVQQTYLNALQRPAACIAEPKHWLSRVVRRVVMNLRRSERRRDERHRAVPTPDAAPTSAELMEREERRRALVTAIDKLPPSLRSVVLLRYFEGLQPREIAARLELPPTTVSTLLHRGLATLRRRLDAEHGDQRRAWLWPLCLPPTVLLPTSPPPFEIMPVGQALTTGLLAMTMKTKLLAAALLLAVTAGALVLWRADDPQLTRPLTDPGGSPPAAAVAVDHDPVATPAMTANEAASAERQAAAAVAQPATLAVTVVWGKDQSRAAGIEVELWRRGGNDLFDRPRATTDARGMVDFEDLVPGRYTPACDRGDTKFGKPVELVAGQHGEARIELGAGLTARGRVVDTNDRPVADADLVVANWGGGSTTRLGKSAADGTFELRAVAITCHIGARKPGYKPSSMRTFTTEEGAQVDFTIQLHGGGGSITGTVFDPSGAPFAGAAVRVGTDQQNHHKLPDGASAMGPQPEEVRSDEHGRFVLSCVLPGSVPVAVRAPGLAPWSEDVLVAAGSTTDVQVHLLAGAIVHGVVKDEHGMPIAGADVRVGGWDEYTSGRTRTADDGAFRLEGLRIGAIEAVASDDQLGSVTETLDLVAGVERRWDAILSVGLALRGRLLDADDEPVSGAMLEASLDPWQSGDRWFGNTNSDKEGRFTIPNCLPGRTLNLKVRRKSVFPELDLHEVAVGPEELVVRMPKPAWVYITGSVFGPDGEIVPNIDISPQYEDHGSSPVATVDPATGVFELGPYPPGRYRVTISADGFPRLRLERVLQPDERWQVGELRLARGGTLALQVVSDAVDAERQRATVFDAQGRVAARVELQQGGGRSEPLAPGDYELLVTNGKASAMVPFTVQAGIETRLDVPLVAGEQVELKCTAPVGVSFRGAVSIVMRDARGLAVWRGSAWTRAGSAAVTCRIPKGSYRLEATWRDCVADQQLDVSGPTESEVALVPK